MKRFLLFIFTLFAIPVFSQHIIRGVILDSASHDPVPYATVSCEKLHAGTISDSSSHFVLSLKDSIAGNILHASCIGYRDTLFRIMAKDTFVTIYLSKDPLTLAPFSFSLLDTNRLCKQQVGAIKKPWPIIGNYMANAGMEMALYFPPTGDSDGVITSIRFFIREEGVPTTPFRALLYYVDPVTKAPGMLMIDSSIILHADKGNEWVVADLSSMNLHVPRGGFFVSMQWLPESADAHYSFNLDHYEVKGDGQVLGMTHQIDYDGTWAKFFINGAPSEWVHYTEKDWVGYSNVMIGATIFTTCETK